MQYTECTDIFYAMYFEVGDLNPYALDYPVCTEDSTKGRGLAKRGRTQRTWLLNHLLGSMSEDGKESESVTAIRKQLKLEPVESYEPCADDYMTSYLAQANVKAAMHVNPDIDWVDCSRSIQ